MSCCSRRRSGSPVGLEIDEATLTGESSPVAKGLAPVHISRPLAAGAVSVIFTLGLLRGQPLGETSLAALALAVAAIPEGLPAVVTVTLTVGSRQMAKVERSSSAYPSLRPSAPPPSSAWIRPGR